MSEMVERTAETLWDKFSTDYERKFYDWEDPDNPARAKFIAAARDTLRAMREPSAPVLRRLEHLLDTQGHDQTLEQSWGLLIDAALGEEPKA